MMVESNALLYLHVTQLAGTRVCAKHHYVKLIHFSEGMLVLADILSLYVQIQIPSLYELSLKLCKSILLIQILNLKST